MSAHDEAALEAGRLHDGGSSGSRGSGGNSDSPDSDCSDGSTAMGPSSSEAEFYEGTTAPPRSWDGAVDVIAQSSEWAGLEDSACETNPTPGRLRRKRTWYHSSGGRRTMAHTIVEREERLVSNKSRPARGSSLAKRISSVSAVVGVLLFVSLYGRILVVIHILSLPRAVQASMGCNVWSVAWLFVFDAMFIVFQIMCVERDRHLLHKRFLFWHSRSFCRLFALEVYKFVILGILSGWQLLRSYRQSVDPYYRDSYIASLSDQTKVGDGARPLPRFSSHLAFVFEMPFVARMAYSFLLHGFDIAADGKFDWFDAVALASFSLSFTLLTASLMAFDHCISSYVQSQYSSDRARRFMALHFAYRASEICTGFLQFGPTLFLLINCPRIVVALVAVDFAWNFFALSWASKGFSKRALFLCIPMAAANLALFVDSRGLRRPAARLTCLHDAWRVVALAKAVVLFGIVERQEGFKGRHNVVMALMVLSAIACLLLRTLTSVRLPPMEKSLEADSMSRAQQNVDGAIFGKAMDMKYVTAESDNLASYVFTKGVGEQFALLAHMCARTKTLRLSRLEELDKLGEGGFGAVYKVLDTKTGEHYALKLQRISGRSSYAVREAEALHTSAHPFIVRVIDIFRTSEFYGILMELCNKDLNRCILDRADAGGRAEGLPRVEVQHYAACMVLALEYLHGRRVAFRDLKPENVLTCGRDAELRVLRGPALGAACPGVANGAADGAFGDPGSFGGIADAKLADFGLARSVDFAEDTDADDSNDDVCSKPSVASVTRAIGTPAFMSAGACLAQTSEQTPQEMMRTLFASDWYAFGCCLLLMLLGERGGRKVCVARHVLLPPAADQIRKVVLAALDAGLSDPDALRLTSALTAADEGTRAGAAEVRNNGYLQEAVDRADERLQHVSPKTPTSRARLRSFARSR